MDTVVTVEDLKNFAISNLPEGVPSSIIRDVWFDESYTEWNEEGTNIEYCVHTYNILLQPGWRCRYGGSLCSEDELEFLKLDLQSIELYPKDPFLKNRYTTA